MRKLARLIRTSVLYGLAVLLAAAYPLTAMAETTPSYSYNAETKRWDTDAWQYDAASGQYKPKTLPTQGPVPGEVIGPTDQKPNGPVDTNQPSQPVPVAQSSTTAETNAQVENNLGSSAATGNATVGGNTSAGSATTGNASASATIVNTVHSTVNGATSGVAHFTADIYGNVTGDITLSPTLNTAMSAPTQTDSSVTVNNSASLTNNVGLEASTGDANVTGNTSAGNATTGNANAVANIINLINSIIAANKSFVGTINIYGSLNGDILVSPEFIPELLASNGGSHTGSIDASLTDNQSIINNIHLGAASGSATVADNTTGGTASTGTAQTNLTILNLSGHTVVAKNSLLIFVNVLGTWVGIIVDAPVGTTAAMLGNGVTTNSVNNQKIDATNNSTITNNVDLEATSGNANVSGNTAAGNATSGNATASANIANVSNSTFGLSDWFGVLFINVFGSWHGSFGVNTSQGDVPVQNIPSTAQSTATVTATNPPPVLFGFVPKTFVPPVASSAQADSSGANAQAVSAQTDNGVVLAAQTGPATFGAMQPALLSPSLIAMMIIGFIGAVVTAVYALSSRKQ